MRNVGRKPKNHGVVYILLMKKPSNLNWDRKKKTGRFVVREKTSRDKVLCSF